MDNLTLTDIKKYTKSVLEKSQDPLHDWDHLVRVDRVAKQITGFLEIGKELDSNLLQAACYLHDVPINIPKMVLLGPVGKHLFEKRIVKKHLPGILKRFDLNDKERKVLIEAIVHHPFSVPYRCLNRSRNNYTRILQDSDSIDFFNTEREEKLKKSKYISPIYYLMSVVSKKVLTLGRKKMSWFLNYPEVAEEYKY